MPTKLKKIKYYGSIAGLYLLMLLFGSYTFKPLTSNGSNIVMAAQAQASRVQPIKPMVSGMPTRIVIASLGIDLSVDKGYYDAGSASWSLSGYHAQYAILSPMPNDTSGNTFIYGHNNPYVFGPLKRIESGAQAKVYTSNHHVFTYTFVKTNAVTPNNTSVLMYQGAPIMTIQTCSGVWNEQRQMYSFKFTGVST